MAVFGAAQVGARRWLAESLAHLSQEPGLVARCLPARTKHWTKDMHNDVSFLEFRTKTWLQSWKWNRAAENGWPGKLEHFLYALTSSACDIVASNYRPISLTSVASKIMERVISVQMTSFLLQNNTAKHGFLQGLSTTSNLLETFNDWTVAIQG